MVLANAEMPTYAIVLILIAFPALFVGIWSLVCWLIALLGGWSGLAGRYRTREGPPPGAEGGLFGRMGLANYRGVLQIGFADDGLDLRVMALFRPGHPPLRIPWHAIHVEEETSSLFFGRGVRLRLGERGPRLLIAADVWARRPR